MGRYYTMTKNKTLDQILDRINELQQVIDLETEDANSGCIRSRQLVINAELEKEEIQDKLDLVAEIFQLA